MLCGGSCCGADPAGAGLTCERVWADSGPILSTAEAPAKGCCVHVAVNPSPAIHMLRSVAAGTAGAATD